MSSIPNSAMPHAGGGTTSSETNHNRSGSEHGYSGNGSYRSPETYSRDADFFSDRSRSDMTLMDRARDHKTGIAVGIAVGAIAAAAIPFMLSGRRRSSEYDRDLYVDKRTSGWSEGDTYASRDGTASCPSSKLG